MTKIEKIDSMKPISAIIRIYFLIILSSLIYKPVSGQITLEECQTKARNNYPLIKQFELIEKSKEYTLSNANKAYLPQLDITIIAGIVEGFPSFGPAEESSSTDFNMISVFQFNQLIWDGGITKAKKGITEASSEVEKAELEISLFSLEDRVNNLYFGILLIEEQLQQLDILKSTLERNMKRVEIAVENGTAYTSDIDELKVELINTDQKKEELTSNRSAYINVLAAMIGEEIDGSTNFTRPDLNITLFTLDNNRPELRMFQNQEHLIEARSRIDKSMLYPKIGLLGFGTLIRPGVEFGTSTLDNIFIGGLSVNWSLGALYKNGNNKKLTGINLERVKVQRETFLFNNNLDLTQTGIELEKYQKLIEQDKEILSLKSRIKDAYETKYENGINTLSELLDRTNEESVAKQNLVVHEIQYLMKAYQYKNKTGN